MTEKGKTMYKSPISIYETAMQTIIEQRENAIFAKVQDAFDVQVDKEELIRALQYDRGQYDKGYRDGEAAAAPRWISVADSLPGFDIERVLVVINGNFVLGYPKMDTDRYLNGRWVRYGDNVTHWMPLPEPPKEDE